jgi:hypothetical protein
VGMRRHLLCSRLRQSGGVSPEVHGPHISRASHRAVQAAEPCVPLLCIPLTSIAQISLRWRSNKLGPPF